MAQSGGRLSDYTTKLNKINNNRAINSILYVTAELYLISDNSYAGTEIFTLPAFILYLERYDLSYYAIMIEFFKIELLRKGGCYSKGGY